MKVEKINLISTDSNLMKLSNRTRLSACKTFVLILLASLVLLYVFTITNYTLRGFLALQRTTEIPTIYFITPTYKRGGQIAELTRLAQTLCQVPNLYWILVEESSMKSPVIADLLARKLGSRAMHMCSGINETKHTGELRIKCVHWVRENAGNNSVVYFGDDDNSYDTELFEEIRTIKKVGMFPVGSMDNGGISSPIIREGKCVGFYDHFLPRKFRVDMAGFAVNVKFLKERPNVTMSNADGYQEDSFLRSLAPFDFDDIEPKAKNCEKILVWHLQAYKGSWISSINDTFINPQGLDYMNNTNLIQLKDLL